MADEEIVLTAEEREQMELPPVEDLKVDLADKAPKKETKAKEPEVEAAAEETKPAPVSADDGIADLKRQMKEMESRAAAEKAALLREKERLEQDYRTQSQDAQLTNVTQAIDRFTAEAQVAENEYADAQQAGDFARSAKAQRAMARCETKLDRLEAIRDQMRPQQRTAEGRVSPQQRPDPRPATEQDRTEQFIATQAPRAQAYLRQHMDLLADEKKNNRLRAAHFDALADGHVEHSDSYFDYLDTRLGYKQSPSVTAASSQRVTTAAPVNRQGSSFSSQSNPTPTVINLSPEEQDMAKQLFSDEKDEKGNPVDPRRAYAKYKAQCLARGDYNRFRQ